MAIKHHKHVSQLTQRAKKFQSPGHYTTQDRDKIDAADFGDPANKKYPIVTQKDVLDAAHLIGKAENPDAVKARIIAIAKRKGFALPDAWQESAERRGVIPEVLRANQSDVQHVGYAAITRVDPDKREVTLTATSEALDSFKTRFDYEASKDAFTRWAGNIREMHQPKAVGNRVNIEFDDARRAVDVTLRISKGAQDTWEKVLDGTLKGGSIGASNVIWEKPINRSAGDQTEKIAKKYDLVELSLVDNPSNPDAVISAIRSMIPDETLLDAVEEPRQVGVLETRPKGQNNPAALSPAIAAAMAVAYGDITDDQSVSSPLPSAASELRAAITPQEAHMGMNAKQRQREAQQRAAQERAKKIQQAGDAAITAANLGTYLPNHGSYDAYAQRVAQVRGAAEAQAAKAIAPVMGRFAAVDPALPQEQRFDDPNGIIPAPDTAANPVTVAPEDFGKDVTEQESTSHPLPHIHTHAHTHADGTVHSHPHLHHHESHVMRANMSDEPHVEHGHIYRNGQPYEAALLQNPDLLRGTPWQIDPVRESVDMAGNVKGTQLVAGKMAKSPVSTVQPQGVGHPIIYNSEDTNMLGFAVPVAADPVKPTPTENIILDPQMFHKGGHKPRFDNVNVPVPPMADQDGDYDKDEDQHEMEAGDKVAGTGIPPFTTPDRNIPATPRAAQPEVGMDEFASLTEEVRMALATTIDAEEQRVGARVSQDSMDALHSIRDNALQTAQMVTDHCGCDECQSHSPVIIALVNGTPPDMSDDDEGDEEDDEMRVQLAETQRQTADVLASLVGTVQALQARMGQLEVTAQAIAAMATRFDDLSLTIADQQRMQSATVTRAQTQQQQEIIQLVQSITQRMEGFAADAAETKALVSQIAAQPMTSNAPVAPWTMPVDKRMGGYYGPAHPETPLEQIQAWAQTQPMETQMSLAAQLVRPAQSK